jgi:hypothetical protein
MNHEIERLVKRPVVLSLEDRSRMARLYEEVRIRLEEMAMIAARNLKMNSGWDAEVQFVAHAPETEVEAVELIRTARGCGCYDYRLGECFEVETERGTK